MYGMWLSRAFDRFQEEMRLNRVSGSFDNWVNSRCKVKQTRARQLKKFSKLFSPYKKVLRCNYLFNEFVKNGDIVVKFFESHRVTALPWTHKIDCVCVTCKMSTNTAVSSRQKKNVIDSFVNIVVSNKQ